MWAIKQTVIIKRVIKILFNKGREEGMENINTFVTGVYIVILQVSFYIQIITSRWLLNGNFNPLYELFLNEGHYFSNIKTTPGVN